MMTDDEFATYRAQLKRNRFLPIPPVERNFVSLNPKEFLSEGIDLMRAVVDAGLDPGHSLLDLGCGNGRLALPLTQYMADDGYYLGIDINLSGIAWAHENITMRYPNFEFAVVNARNPFYGAMHEYGQDSLQRSSLPIPNWRRFDMVAAMSLFTHLPWDETIWYFDRITELLRPGGAVVGTFYLVTEPVRAAVHAATCPVPFDLSAEGPSYFARDPEGRFTAFGQDFDAFAATAAAHDLVFEPAGWRPRWDGVGIAADMVVLRRIPSAPARIDTAPPVTEPEAPEGGATLPPAAEALDPATPDISASAPGTFATGALPVAADVTSNILQRLAGSFRPRIVLQIGTAGTSSLLSLDQLLRPERIVRIDDHTQDDLVGRYIREQWRDIPRPPPLAAASDSTSLVPLLTEHVAALEVDLVFDKAKLIAGGLRNVFEQCFPLLRPGGLYVIEPREAEAPAPSNGAAPQQRSQLACFVVDLVMAQESMPQVIGAIQIEGEAVIVTRGPCPIERDGSFRLNGV